MDEHSPAGLARGSAQRRRAGHSLVRVVTALTGLGSVLGSAGIAWSVAPHGDEASTGAETPTTITTTPVPVPPTLAPVPLPTVPPGATAAQRAAAARRAAELHAAAEQAAQQAARQDQQPRRASPPVATSGSS